MTYLHVFEFACTLAVAALPFEPFIPNIIPNILIHCLLEILRWKSSPVFLLFYSNEQRDLGSKERETYPELFLKIRKT